jgi:hypothetical protein
MGTQGAAASGWTAWPGCCGVWCECVLCKGGKGGGGGKGWAHKEQQRQGMAVEGFAEKVAGEQGRGQQQQHC